MKIFYLTQSESRALEDTKEASAPQSKKMVLHGRKWKKRRRRSNGQSQKWSSDLIKINPENEAKKFQFWRDFSPRGWDRR